MSMSYTGLPSSSTVGKVALYTVVWVCLWGLWGRDRRAYEEARRATCDKAVPEGKEEANTTGWSREQ